MDRLTYALYRKGANYGTDVNLYSVQNISYDLNGNIETLQRNGGTNVAIDDLTYGYSGNQLKSVSDVMGTAEGFTDGANSTDEYGYDANGNLIRDDNKGITSITYNHLNLPEVITLSGGTITFLYDANGNKLRKTVNGTSQDYLGGIEYSGGVVEAIYHEEGRATPSGTSWQYEYYLKDHLGNTRVIFTDANNDDIPEIIQEADYYPFGMRHQNATATNHYLYNGKELNRDLGLDWYDYGFRWYDMELGRFPSVDPLSSRFSSESNYSYAGNSPTVLIDVDGKFKFDPQTLSLLKTKYPTSYKYLVETRPGMPGNLLELADNVTVTKAMVTTSANYNLRRIFGSNAPWTEKDYFRSFQSDIFRLSVSQIKHDFTYGNGQYIKFVTHPGGLGAGTNESVGGYNHFNSGNSIDDFTDKQQQEKRIELNIGFLENIENATTDLEKQAGLAQLTSVLIHEYLEAYGDDGPVSFNYKGNEFSVGAYAAQYQIYGQGIPFSLTRPTWEGLGNYQSGIEAIEKAMHGGDMGVIPTLPK